MSMTPTPHQPDSSIATASRNQREGRYVGKWRGIFRRTKGGYCFGLWPGPRYDDPHGCELTRKDRKRDKMQSRLYTDDF